MTGSGAASRSSVVEIKIVGSAVVGSDVNGVVVSGTSVGASVGLSVVG